jgi:hypothetical protein
MARPMRLLLAVSVGSACPLVSLRSRFRPPRHAEVSRATQAFSSARVRTR